MGMTSKKKRREKRARRAQQWRDRRDAIWEQVREVCSWSKPGLAFIVEDRWRAYLACVASDRGVRFVQTKHTRPWDSLSKKEIEALERLADSVGGWKPQPPLKHALEILASCAE